MLLGSVYVNNLFLENPVSLDRNEWGSIKNNMDQHYPSFHFSKNMQNRMAYGKY